TPTLTLPPRGEGSLRLGGDLELVARLDPDAAGGPRGQLHDAVGAKDERDQPDPGPQPEEDFDHPARAVDEDGIDREAHEHHVDPVAALDQQAAPLAEPGPAHQAQAPGEHVARHLQRLGHQRAVLFNQAHNYFPALYAGFPAPATPDLLVLEGVDDDDHGRAHQDDEQG